jgi:hypothetical protein
MLSVPYRRIRAEAIKCSVAHARVQSVRFGRVAVVSRTLYTAGNRLGPVRPTSRCDLFSKQRHLSDHVYHGEVPPLSALRLSGRLLAFAFAFMTAAACGSPASTTSSVHAAGQSVHVSAGERRAVQAFDGTYQVRSVVTGTTGDYSESIGAVHSYTWQAIPECGSLTCVVKVTSSSGSHTVFTYSDGEYHGSGSGSAVCYDPGTGKPAGYDPTALDDTLVPATTSSPITSLAGVVHLTLAGDCGGSGTGTFRYTLARTGSAPVGAAA